MRVFALFLLTTLAAGIFAQMPAPDPRELVRGSVQKDRINANRAADYTYVQRTESREKNRQGQVVKTESATYDVMMIGHDRFRRLIAKNDTPLPEKEARRAQEAFDKALRRHESRAGKAAKEDEDGRAILAELPDAFVFNLLGPDSIDGRAVWVVDAKPKPGYRGKAKRWELLTKFQGRLWIDQAELQWVRVEAETIAPVSFGWILARLEPGAKLTFQQARVHGTLWLPSQATTGISARLGFKKIRNDTIVTWKDYRKYRTDSHIVSAVEAEPPAPSKQP